MRLSKAEIKNLLHSIHSLDPAAKTYLFGSRTRDDIKGGDIDIAVHSSRLTLLDKVAIKQQFFKEFGEQKIDILLVKDPEQFFWKTIQEHAILLV